MYVLIRCVPMLRSMYLSLGETNILNMAAMRHHRYHCLNVWLAGIDTMYAVISTKITGFPEVWTGFTFWNVLCITCTIVLFELLYLIIGSFLRFIFAYGYDADAVAKQVKYTTKIVEKIVKKIVVPSTHAANASAAVPNVQAELSVETTATHTSADGISASVPVDTAAQSAQSGSTSAQYVENRSRKTSFCGFHKSGCG